MKYVTLRTEVDAPCCIITLNRPEKRNAISVEMMREIMAAAKSVEQDAAVRGLIVYGGPSFFSAGADLNEALQVKTPAESEAYFGEWRALNRTLEELSKPVIAAIEGFCLTGGMEMALACDLRIAGRGASFAITSAKIGTVAGAGGTQRLPRLVGPAKALEMLLCAEPIDAAEAHRIGLVNQVVDTGAALSRAKAIVQIYAERGPLSLAYAKQAVHRGLQMDLAAGLDLEKRLVSEIYATEDKQEGISAFLQKRRPVFRGR